MTDSPQTPHSVYQQRLDERRQTETALSRRADQIGTARLVVFLAGLVLAWGSTFAGWMSGWWLLVPVAVFTGLVVRHDRVLLERDRVRRAVAWYEHGLARIEDCWPGRGPRGDRFADREHLYAQDLDLFGEGSLFQLLCTAQTQTGEATLAAWLRSPGRIEEVGERQTAVRDLRERVHLRERLAVAGADLRAAVHPEKLEAWAIAPRVLAGPWPRVLAVAITLTIPAAIVAWNAGAPIALPILSLLALGVLARRYQKRTNAVMHAAGEPARELTILGRVSQTLRQETFTAAKLDTLREALATPNGEVDDAARQLQRLVEMHDWQHNFMFAPVAALLFWELHCAFAVEAWRARHGAAVATWLHAIGELEALSALASYAYEHPDDPFPELTDTGRGPVYDATALAHPLIPAADAVANDVGLDTEPRFLVVSGSNMSGKTTLLRSVGVSVVMAQMGAPVRAGRLRLSPMAIGATLRIEDSLQAGRSRFYAEVLRLGQVVETARAGPTLFLFDELFHGTNSHDRTEGARGLLGSLLTLETIGLVTTHDLALSAIGDHLAPAVRNVHFDDTLVDREMRFDYRLKPGPVTRSNALAIMRAVGLDVADPEETASS